MQAMTEISPDACANIPDLWPVMTHAVSHVFRLRTIPSAPRGRARIS